MFAPKDGVHVAGEADVPGLIALINTLAHEATLLFIMAVDAAAGVVALRAHLAAIAENRNETVLVAARGGRLVGLLTAVRGLHPARRGVVDIGIGVEAGQRRRGVGTALLMAAEDWAAGAAIDRLQLTVVSTNAPAIALYHRMGYAIEGTLRASARVDGRTVDQYMMAKLLAPAAR